MPTKVGYRNKINDHTTSIGDNTRVYLFLLPRSVVVVRDAGFAFLEGAMTKGLTPEQDVAMGLVKSIQTMAMLVPTEALNELTHIFIRANTTLPIVAPTFYRDKREEIHINTKCLQAFASYRHRLTELQTEAVKKGLIPHPG